MTGPPALFALEASRPFGARVAASLGVGLSPHEERDFEDGEHKTRPLAPVRGQHAYVIQSLHGDDRESVNDKLCRLLFFCGALGEASAASVTAVVPYLCYARKDRQTQPRDPVTTRYVAALFEAVGVDRVIALDVHNLAAFQNAFRCRTEHVSARPILVWHLADRLVGRPLTVVAPDAGGVKRANIFRTALSEAVGAPVASAFAEKLRSGGVVTGDLLVGDLDGRVAIIVDDLIATGGTMARTARRCREQGATEVLAVATHGLFSSGAGGAFGDASIDAVVVTDSVPQDRLSSDAARRKLEVVEIAAFLAEAIRRVHAGGSVIELLATPYDPGALESARPRSSARAT